LSEMFQVNAEADQQNLEEERAGECAVRVVAFGADAREADQG